MAITFVASSSAINNGTTSISPLNKPTGTVDNDIILIMVYYHDGTATITNFNTLEAKFFGTRDITNHIFTSFWKIASGEPATYTVNFGVTTWAIAVAYTLRGTATTIANHSKKADASAYTLTLPQAVATINGTNDATVYQYGGGDSANSNLVVVTMPGSLSNVAAQNNSSVGGNVSVGWGTNLSSPGNATSDTLLDYMDTFVDIAPLVIPSDTPQVFLLTA